MTSAEIIEALEKKGMRIAIFPQKEHANWYWTSGVYIGDNKKANWVDCKNGLPMACYRTYMEALKAAVDYCTNDKGKVSR